MNDTVRCLLDIETCPGRCAKMVLVFRRGDE